MEAYFEAREMRPPSQREQTLLASLRELVEYARRQSPYYGQTLAAVDITSLTSRAALA